MYFCQPAKRSILNFTSVLGKRRKTLQAPANFSCEINCKKKKGSEAEKEIFKIALFGMRTQKDSLLVRSFCSSARTMTGYGNSTVSAGNLSACQETHDKFLWLDCV